MTQVQMGSLDVAGGSLFYEMAGEGPVVTLIHPGLWDSRTWDLQVPVLLDAGFRVLRYDVRGYGRSSRLTGEPYSNVRDLAALLDALDVTQTLLVGCSMGGAIAIDLTLEHPNRVQALVVAASGLGGFEPLEEENDWWEVREGPIDAAIEAGDLTRAEDLRLEIWAPLGTSDDAGRRIREIAFDNIHEMTMDESVQEELDPPAAMRLGEIDVPTLVLIAEHDPPFMRRCGELIAQGVLGARSVTIEGADHVVNLRQPEAFDRAVLPFLTEVV
ncbi:MAG: alpha/beta hydrolase [Actinomycetota bacterium]